MASRTYITNPKGSSGNSGATSGGISMGAQGAAVGAAVAGPVGAVVGGVVGAVGGLIGGGQADKADYYRSIARQWEKQGRARQASLELRNMLREFRLARANAIMGINAEAGGNQSSAPVGAVGSLGSQYAFNDAYYRADYQIKKQITKYYTKAGKANANAQQSFATVGGLLQLGGVAYGAYSAVQKAQGDKLATTMSTTGYDKVKTSGS